MIYVPQEPMYKNNQGMLVPKFRIESAEKYGELKILLPYGPVMLAPQPMMRKLKQELKTFCCDDFILPVGDPVAIGAVIAIAADMNRGLVQILRWDRKVHDYQILKFNTKGSKYIADNPVQNQTSGHIQKEKDHHNRHPFHQLRLIWIHCRSGCQMLL